MEMAGVTTDPLYMEQILRELPGCSNLALRWRRWSAEEKLKEGAIWDAQQRLIEERKQRSAQNNTQQQAKPKNQQRALGPPPRTQVQPQNQPRQQPQQQPQNQNRTPFQSQPQRQIPPQNRYTPGLHPQEVNTPDSLEIQTLPRDRVSTRRAKA